MRQQLSVNTIGFGLRPLSEPLGDLAAYGIARLGVHGLRFELGNADSIVAALRSGGFEVVDVVEPAVFELSLSRFRSAGLLLGGSPRALSEA